MRCIALTRKKLRKTKPSTYPVGELCLHGVTAEIAGVTYDANRTLLNLSGAPGSPCILLPTENLMIIADADAEFIADDATIIYYYRQVEP